MEAEHELRFSPHVVVVFYSGGDITVDVDDFDVIVLVGYQLDVFVWYFACGVPPGCEVDHHEGVLVQLQILVHYLQLRKLPYRPEAAHQSPEHHLNYNYTSEPIPINECRPKFQVKMGIKYPKRYCGWLTFPYFKFRNRNPQKIMHTDNADSNVALFIKKTYEILEVSLKPLRIRSSIISYTGFLQENSSLLGIPIPFRLRFCPVFLGTGTFTPSSGSSTCTASTNPAKTPPRIYLATPTSRREEKTFFSRWDASWRTRKETRITRLSKSHIRLWNPRLNRFYNPFPYKIIRTIANLNWKRRTPQINAKYSLSPASLNLSCKAWSVPVKSETSAGLRFTPSCTPTFRTTRVKRRKTTTSA